MVTNTISIDNNGIVNFGDNSLDILNKKYKCSKIEKLYKGPNSDAQNLYVLKYPENENMALIADEYQKCSNVNYALPNYILKTSNTPNDYYYSSQWGLTKIQADDAWDFETGGSEVVIGINDTGLDWQHPDLENNVWQNLGEDYDNDGHVLEYNSGTGEWEFDSGDINNYDDDGNGYDDDFIGWNFKDDNNNPQHTSGASHGTSVAGTAAGVTNNTIGTSGVSWNSKIMAMKVGDSIFIDVSSAISGIYYGIDNGCDIINTSWQTSSNITTIHTALQSAWNADIVLTAAAGNIPSPYTTNYTYYPGAYSEVIGVAALEYDDTKRFSSTWGSWVDVSAPYFNYWPIYDKFDEEDPHKYSSGGLLQPQLLLLLALRL